MRISDWSSDVYSSELTKFIGEDPFVTRFWERVYGINVEPYPSTEARLAGLSPIASDAHAIVEAFKARGSALKSAANVDDVAPKWLLRSEEHTSELQSLMRISYAVFCLKKKKHKDKQYRRITIQKSPQMYI